MLQVPGGSESQQVMLQVRFAEVNRRALTELGRQRCSSMRERLRRAIDDAAVRRAGLRRRETERHGVQRFPESVLLRLARKASAACCKALAVEGRVPEPGRAEPDCLQRPGSQLPRRRRVPGADRPGRHGNAVTVVFKEFGIRLNFKPTIAGDVIRLKVRPEVSALDFANGITLAGLPHSGADDAARRNRRRAARRPVVRDCRPARQHQRRTTRRRFRS